MHHVRGAPYHPMTQGKIERWHQTLKNRILLENYYLPGDLEAQIEAFVADYNHRRYHESIGNLTPADVLRTRPDHPAAERKDQTPDHLPTPLAAPTKSSVTSSTNEPEPPLISTARCLKNSDDGHSGTREHGIS